jgi:hypothetical protein
LLTLSYRLRSIAQSAVHTEHTQIKLEYWTLLGDRYLVSLPIVLVLNEMVLVLLLDLNQSIEYEKTAITNENFTQLRQLVSSVKF